MSHQYPPRPPPTICLTGFRLQRWQPWYVEQFFKKTNLNLYLLYFKFLPSYHLCYRNQTSGSILVSLWKLHSGGQGEMKREIALERMYENR